MRRSQKVQKKRFLSFVTGSDLAPVGGLQARQWPAGLAPTPKPTDPVGAPPPPHARWVKDTADALRGDAPLAAAPQADPQLDAAGSRPVVAELLPGEYLLTAFCQGGRVDVEAPGQAMSWFPSLPAWVSISFPVDALR